MPTSKVLQLFPQCLRCHLSAFLVFLIWIRKLSHTSQGHIFQGYCVSIAGEHEIELGQVKTLESSLVLPRSSHFSVASISAPQVAVGLWLIPRVLKKVILRVFCQLLYRFLEVFLLTSSSLYFLDENVFFDIYSESKVFFLLLFFLKW